MPLVQTRGAASAQGFGEFAQVTAVNYIEDVFSCFLYTGNGSTQTITNGIDLSGKGGLTWIKCRNAARPNTLWDTQRGALQSLSSNSTDISYTELYGVNAFNSNGFAMNGATSTNNTNDLFASWTFRKQPKFFDVVTWTGTGSNTTIAHALGSVPACIMVKRTDTTGAWQVYHRSLANTEYLVLNATASAATGATRWNSTTPTSSVFSLGTDATVNASGGTYVAYIFAHDAGGFGLTGTDNVISCGTFTTSTVADTITLGYEPQWVLIKSASSATNWYIFDNMRGIPTDSSDSRLMPNLSTAESTDANYLDLTATGFTSNFQSIFGDGINLIYIAIRRPMKVPTVGTSVFAPVARTGTGSATTVTGVGFAPDSVWSLGRVVSGYNHAMLDKLRGPDTFLNFTGTQADTAVTPATLVSSFNMDGVSLGTDPTYNVINASTFSYINYFFQRAPSYMDEVCYTGTGASSQVLTHNLTVVPELMIVKRRSDTRDWNVYASPLGATKFMFLNTQDPVQTDTMWNDTAPTSSVFTVGSYQGVNASGSTYVAYLFATCAGVSKVGSYTGTATTLQIDCGFTAGARFVLIKRTDVAGGWFVWDSARGIVAGNDPYLLLNTTAAEVTGTDYVDTYNAGFEISSTAPVAINASGGAYIFLAIA